MGQVFRRQPAQRHTGSDAQQRQGGGGQACGGIFHRIATIALRLTWQRQREAGGVPAFGGDGAFGAAFQALQGGEFFSQPTGGSKQKVAAAAGGVYDADREDVLDGGVDAVWGVLRRGRPLCLPCLYVQWAMGVHTGWLWCVLVGYCVAAGGTAATLHYGVQLMSIV